MPEPTASAPEAAAETPQKLPWAIISSVAMLLLLASLDQTIVSTALPTIVADLGGLEHLSWVVTAYILTSTIVAPLYGKLGDLYGRRNTIFVSVALFLTGSVLCGFSQTMLHLILSRALQGLGGGGLMVLALSIIGDVVAPKDRGKIQGLFAAVFSTSSVLGPLIGGWFVEAVSWHWIFFINLPLGGAALAIFASVFRPTGKRVQHRIDWEGAAVLTVGLSSLVLVTSLGGRQFAWGSPLALVLIALALISTVLFIWFESRASEPVIPLSLFKLNIFTVTSAVGFVAGVAMFGALTFVPIYLQIAKGSTPTVSGLQLMPMTLGILTASTFAGQYMGRTGRYYILPLMGTGLLALAMLGLTQLGVDTPYWLIGLCLLFIGLGMGNIFPVVTTAVQNSVPREVLGTATASGILFRQIGGSLGVAMFGAIFTSGMTAQMPAGIGGGEGFSMDPAELAQMPDAVRETIGHAVVAALHPIYFIAAGVALLGFLIATRLREVPLSSKAPGLRD